MYKDCVQPYIDENRQAWEAFKQLPSTEITRRIAGAILEQLVQVMALKIGGRILPVIGSKTSGLAKGFFDLKSRPVGVTPEGFNFIIDVTPELGPAAEEIKLMEAEESAKLPSQAANIKPRTDSVPSSHVEGDIAKTETAGAKLVEKGEGGPTVEVEIARHNKSYKVQIDNARALR